MNEIKTGFLFAIGLYLGRDVYAAGWKTIDRQLTKRWPKYAVAKREKLRKRVIHRERKNENFVVKGFVG